jgi:hypothetical protein
MLISLSVLFIGIILLHVVMKFPWRHDVGALSRNNAEHTIVMYATIYIGILQRLRRIVGIVSECDIVEDHEHYCHYEIVVYGLLVICSLVTRLLITDFSWSLVLGMDRDS